MLKKWFSDSEDTNPSFLQTTRNILIVVISANALILLLITGLIFTGSQNITSSIALSVTLVLEVISFAFLLRGNPLPAKVIIPIAILAAVTYAAINSNGLHDLSVLGFPAAIVVGALLLRRKSFYITTPIAIVSVEIVAFADILGFTNSDMAQKTDTSDAIVAGVLLLAISGMLNLLIIRLHENTEEARKNAALLTKANNELLDAQMVLQNQFIERTRELDEANKSNERRTANFEAAAQLARTVASIRDINKLLPAITNVISAKFDYYHVGIYLNDDAQEYTILTASNSEIGKQLLAGGQQYKISEPGFVSSTAQSGAAHISQNYKKDFALNEETDFGETNSRLVIPMKVERNIIGVIDIHSKRANAFDEIAVDILTILADQTSIAIQNARSYSESQASLAENQMLYGTVIRQAWQTNTRSGPSLGYRFAGTIPTPLDKSVESPEAKAALELGEVVITPPTNKDAASVLAVPLKLRGETIGVISVKMPESLQVSEDETDIVQAAAERVVLALENSTLLEESQRRAFREQTIGQISASISAGTEIDTILKTAVRELGNQISGAQILVELGGENE